MLDGVAALVTGPRRADDGAVDDAPGLAGRLLVATPQLADPSFRRAVVLVLHHDDDGAAGVVLNRPLPVDVGAVLPAWEARVSPPVRLFQGGPVGPDDALGLAVTGPAGGHGPGIAPLVGAVGVVDLDADPATSVGRVDGLRVFAGHSGWAAGQLEDEVAAGAWYVLDADPADVVTAVPDALWRLVLRRQGGSLAIVSTFPDDPSLN